MSLCLELVPKDYLHACKRSIAASFTKPIDSDMNALSTTKDGSQ